ncbi:MAG: hypothetical protein RLZ10_1451 [Bacteroidota bacterium]|jgi:hypothetical protein
MNICKPALSDKFLLDEIIKLKNKYDCKIFIETGTHVGGSSKIASNFFDRVITCENYQPFFEMSKENLSSIPNVELHNKSSIGLLEEIFPLKERVILFLDAHGADDFPLLGELKLCKLNEIKPIIIIHDFYVPDSNGNAKFTYDVYQGRNNDLNYIQPYLDEIYGEGLYHYYFLDEQELSGVIYIEPIID